MEFTDDINPFPTLLSFKGARLNGKDQRDKLGISLNHFLGVPFFIIMVVGASLKRDDSLGSSQCHLQDL